MLVFHDEIDRIPGFAAAEALVNAFGRRNGERRCFFIVERAQSDLVDATTAKHDKITNHLLNAGGLDNVVDGIVVDHGGE
jgi:hypothetical protein